MPDTHGSTDRCSQYRFEEPLGLVITGAMIYLHRRRIEDVGFCEFRFARLIDLCSRCEPHARRSNW